MQNSVIATKKYDCFVSHASEDKTDFVEDLVNNLQSRGLKVWYDANIMTIGDSLRKSIDAGLKDSLCGVVILSKNFFEKNWTDYELNGLIAMLNSGQNKSILPVWHNVTVEDVREYSPSLSDIVAGDSKYGVETVARMIVKAIQRLKEPLDETISPSNKIGKESSELITQYETDQSNNIKKEDAKKIIEELILDDKNIICIHKFLNRQVEELVKVLTQDFSTLAQIQQNTYNTFYERVLAYDVYCENILQILITGAYWGSEKYYTLWLNTFKRLANLKVMESGYTSLINLQKYPSLLIYYALLLVGLIKEDFSLLYNVFHGFELNVYNDNEVEPISVYVPNKIIPKEVFNYVLKTKYHTPVNDHLHDILRPFFIDIVADNNEFAVIFDRVEYFIGLEFGDIRINNQSRFWSPTGRFLWRYDFGLNSSFVSKSHPSKYFDKLSLDGTVFSYKLLGQTKEKYDNISQQYRDFIQKIHFL